MLNEKQLENLAKGREIGRKVAWERNRGRKRTSGECQNISLGQRNLEREKIICNLYENGLTSIEIAQKLGLSTRGICLILERNKIKIRGVRGQRLINLNIQSICKEYQTGKPLIELCKKYKMGYYCLKNILNSFSIEIDTNRRNITDKVKEVLKNGAKLAWLKNKGRTRPLEERLSIGRNLKKYYKTHSSWLKGLKGYTNSGSFKHGQTSWNTGIKYLQITGSKNYGWKGGLPKCVDCGRELSSYISKTYRCKKCDGIARRGKNSSGWKGGIYPLKLMLRDLKEHANWIKEVLERDSYTCQKCGKDRIFLHCHHIKPLSKILEEFLKQYSQFSPIDDKETLVRLAITYQSFWDINNGITYCKKCHYLLHTKNKLEVAICP